MERCWRVDTVTAALIFGRRGTHGTGGSASASQCEDGAAILEGFGARGRKPAIALQALLAAPEQAVEMLKQNLKPAAATGLAGLLERVTALQLDDAKRAICSNPIRRQFAFCDSRLRNHRRRKPQHISRAFSKLRPIPCRPSCAVQFSGVILAEQLNTAESWRLIEGADGWW